MNTGEFHIALDEKGRLLMPSRIRNELRGNSVVITRAIDRQHHLPGSAAAPGRHHLDLSA